MTTYNAQTDWKRINWQAVKEFRLSYLDAKHDWRWWYAKRQSAKCGSVTFQTPNGVSKTWVWEAQTETIMHAFMSFLHGKQHMTKKRIPLCDASGGTEIVPVTAEMQAQLVGELWMQFLLSEPAVVAPDAPKAANG